MKKLSYGLIAFAIAIITLTGLNSCGGKSEKKEETTTKVADTAAAPAPAPAPVEISPDETLQNALKDATKDYPTVTATVKDGEVTLTGTLERSKLQKLMETLHGLNPKKINNELKLK